MRLERPWPRAAAVALCVTVAAVAVLQVSGVLQGSSARTAGATSTPRDVGLNSGTPLLSATPPTFESGRDATSSATSSATVHATTPPTMGHSQSAGPSPSSPPWQPDPVLVQAKADGRVVIDPSGAVVILSAAPPVQVYPAARSLDTSWTGLIQEPAWTGVDDSGASYIDYNYALLCGPGTGTVVLYYWRASKATVTTMSGWFIEPVNLGSGRYVSTYWNAQDAGGYGRGMIMYLAEVEWPVPDRGLSWWAAAGVMRWSVSPPSTYVENLVDGINWEASGQSRLDYFYVIEHASDLTAPALRDHVHSDINQGVPVVVAARTSDGSASLPRWNIKATRNAVNHFVTIVGYDDVMGTYQIIDTCGVHCNDQSARAGVSTITQTALFSLIKAESDNDGIMW